VMAYKTIILKTPQSELMRPWVFPLSVGRQSLPRIILRFATVAVCTFSLAANAGESDGTSQLLNSDGFNNSGVSAYSSEFGAEAGYRECDVCPNKPGQALPVEPQPLAKRCDTCSDTDTMGVNNDTMNTPSDFPDYSQPSDNSPESLKPF